MALSHFLFQLSDQCKPIFTLLRKKKNLCWDDKCTTTFEQLMHPPVLSTPLPGKTLHVYLFVSKYVVNTVTFRNDKNQEKPIYNVSKALLDPELRYTPLEQPILALLIAT